MTKSKTPRLSALLADLHRFTSRKGAKSELAEFLGVSPSRVSEWLGGYWLPSGEISLALREWVLKERAKQNALTVRKHDQGKTTRRKARREIKPSPDQKKR